MSLYIHDGNADSIVRQLADEGRSCGALPRQTSVGGVACAAVLAEHMPLIPESEWLDRVKYCESNGIFIGQRWQGDPEADYQNGLNFCWGYSLAQEVMAVMAAKGMPRVQLAAESLAEDVGYRNAGNGLDSAIAYAAKYGIATRATVPQYKIDPSEWDPSYLTERQKYMPTEWWDLGGADLWAETVTMLMLGHGVYAAYPWWKHAVFLDRLRIGDNGRLEVHTPNSHGPGNDVWIGGSKAVPTWGAFVIRSMTFPQ